MFRTRSRLTWTLTAAFVATLSGLIAAAPAVADTAAPEHPQSPDAGAIYDVYLAILGVTVTIFVLVGGFLLYSAIRFRARPGDPEPPQVHGSTRLEIGWTIVPILVLVGLAAYTLYKIPDVSSAPSQSTHIRVLGQQFAWSFVYPNGAKPKSAAANTLYVEEGTPVVLDITSKDVIHDWWVPQLGPKVDAIPGRKTTTWFRATKPGTYTGRCAEFCGSGHSTMTIVVKVLSTADYQRMMGTA